MVKYSYNAWGYNKVSDINGTEITDENHIGNLNPFRYRRYYYDTETKLYYLKTRYYDPETGRFISQDGIEYLNFHPASAKFKHWHYYLLYYFGFVLAKVNVWIVWKLNL